MKVSEIFITKQRELDTTYPDIGMNEPERSDKIKMYKDAVKKLDKEFKQALFTEYGVLDNPKREKAFSLAWEIGHSSGYNEIEIWFDELVELIK